MVVKLINSKTSQALIFNKKPRKTIFKSKIGLKNFSRAFKPIFSMFCKLCNFINKKELWFCAKVKWAIKNWTICKFHWKLSSRLYSNFSIFHLCFCIFACNSLGYFGIVAFHVGLLQFFTKIFEVLCISSFLIVNMMLESYLKGIMDLFARKLANEQNIPRNSMKLQKIVIYFWESFLVEFLLICWSFWCLECARFIQIALDHVMLWTLKFFMIF